MSMATGAPVRAQQGLLSTGWVALVRADAADVRTALLLGAEF